ncbi:MAG TPA: ion channel [Candidatus Binatia bacterium]|nr:ion channel [Candidatus Binatia bacterium]
MTESPDEKRSLPWFVVLLVALLLEMLLSPIMPMSDGIRTPRIIGLLVLAAILPAVGVTRGSLMLMTPALALQLVSVGSNHPMIWLGTVIARLVIFGYAGAAILRRVLGDRQVTLDTIAGGACGYLLIGMIWGVCYLLIEAYSPGSFQIPTEWRLGPDGDLQAACIYFSFSTLTTVAYGPIVPLRLAAGVVAVTEAVVGQLYLAVMISRLVGLHTSQRSA